MNAARVLDTCDVNYRCYPACARFRRTGDGDSYQRAVARSNEQLIPEPLVLAIAIIGAEPTWMEGYLEAVASIIDTTGRLVDTDRVITRLQLVLADPSLLRPGTIPAIVESVRRAFPLHSIPNAEHEVVLRAPSPADAPGVLELAEYGFKRLLLRMESDAADVDRALRFLQAVSQAGFERTAVECMLAPGIVIDKLLERLLRWRPAQITLCAPESALPRYAHVLQHCDTRAEDGYVLLGLNELVRESDPLVSAFMDGSLEYSLSGLSREAETDRLGIGAGMLSRLGDSFFLSQPDSGAFASAGLNGTGLISHAHHSTADDRMRRAIIHALITASRAELAELAARHRLSLTEEFIDGLAGPILHACPAANLRDGCLSLETRSLAQLVQACSLLNRYR